MEPRRPLSIDRNECDEGSSTAAQNYKWGLTFKILEYRSLADSRLVNNQIPFSMPQQNEIIRVSVSEAARLFGVSTRTVRRAITNEEITYIVVQGRYKINFESLVKWSQQRATTRNKLASNGIGQFVDQWKIRNKLFSPNIPDKKEEVAETIDNPPETLAA